MTNLIANNISIRGLLSRFKGKVLLTLSLVLAESILTLLYPLFIGFAINGLLEQDLGGVYMLGGLGGLALAVGSGRRFYDTRAYSDIYVKISDEMVSKEQAKGSTVSKISARASMLTEFVEFLENSMPMIFESLIGVLGVLVIILTLNLSVFWASIGLFAFMIVIYLFSGKLNFRLNEGYNNEIENQVEALVSQDVGIIREHFKAVTHWNIKLSDLETWNYGAIWLGIIGLLVYAPIIVIGSGIINYGLVFSILMYVFQYIESLLTLPYFIQQIIRLQEITVRLQNEDKKCLTSSKT